MDTELHAGVKREAVARGVSIRSAYEQALRGWLGLPAVPKRESTSKPMPGFGETFCNTAEAAVKLGVSQRWLRQAVILRGMDRHWIGEPNRRGSRFVIPISDIEKLRADGIGSRKKARSNETQN